jgi:RHS repeat-associated protein
MTQQTDPSGNVTTYTWDNRDRLASLTLKNSSGVIQKVVDYTYDAFNQLIGESVTPYSGGIAGATATQRFVYDPLTGEMQLAFNGSGNLTDRYLWGPLVDEVLTDEKVTSLSYGGTLEWFATNNEQSVTDVYQYGTSGTILDHIGYDAFGVASQTNSSNAPQFGYDGVYTDPATGMQYHNDPNSGMRGRWYLPWLQRWANRDEIFPLSGTNPFEYCGNDPTSEIDPSGLQVLITGPNFLYPAPAATGPVPPTIPTDPTTPPGPGWKWRGPPFNPKGGPCGAWDNGKESLHPDFSHPGKPDHWDWVDPLGNQWEYDLAGGTWQGKPGNNSNKPLPQFPKGTLIALGAATGIGIAEIIETFWPVVFAF